MKLLRKILFPIVPVYYLVTTLRNVAYDKGILKSKSYKLPVITVGNLSVGGTGKSPMIEYLIRLLKEEYKLATLSRGYGRDTNDFVIADETATSLTIGDEPFQFYQKFKDIIVSVDINRQHGISQLLELRNTPEVILLDDAFQHRKVKAGLSILLSTYDNLYTNDFVLPTGNLRESKVGAKRADIIVVTKCPNNLDAKSKEKVIKSINPLTYQKVFFSSIYYSNTVYSENKKVSLSSLKLKSFTLVTGIANPKPLLDFLTIEKFIFEHLQFKDHHKFTSAEIELLKAKSLVLTTEKDFMRLKGRISSEILYYLPIETKIINNKDFDLLVKKYVSNTLN